MQQQFDEVMLKAQADFEGAETQAKQLQVQLEERDKTIGKLEKELKSLQSKRDTLIQEEKERMAGMAAKHEKELEKLRSELLRLQQQSKTTFVSEVERAPQQNEQRVRQIKTDLNVTQGSHHNVSTNSSKLAKPELEPDYSSAQKAGPKPPKAAKQQFYRRSYDQNNDSYGMGGQRQPNPFSRSPQNELSNYLGGY